MALDQYNAKDPKTIKTLLSTFHKYRAHVAVLVVLGFLSALLEGVGINAAIPLLSFLLGGGSTPVDTISSTLAHIAAFVHIPFTFRTLLFFILSLFILRAVSTVLFGYIRGWIVADFFYEESRDILSRTLRGSWPFFVGQKTGTIQNTLVRDVQRTSGLLMAVSQVIESFSGFLMYLLVALSISPLTTLFTFLGGGVLLGIIRPLLRRIQNTSDDAAHTEKDIAQSLSEQVIGMKSIKAAAVEEKVFRETGAFMSVLRSLQIRMSFIRAISAALFQPFTLFFIAVAFYISYHSPGFTLISFGATLYLIQKIFTYLESGQSGLHVISESIPYAHSIRRFKSKLTDQEEIQKKDSIPFVFTKELRGEGLRLSYTNGEEVLRGVNFVVRPGEMLAVIGPSGAGKTSLVDIVLRLFKPKAGHLTLDGSSSEEISLKSWRSHFAYVSQDPFLFNGTIEENIRFYRDGISRESIEEAAKQANIFDFVSGLPNGFETEVGDRGIMLSGGQRQRVVLARALAGAPAVLVLDEATSALDSDSERLIQESIRNLHGKVAVLVIAHRLSTIESADHIIVLENGQITEEGSPEELLRNPESYFARHYTAQKPAVV